MVKIAAGTLPAGFGIDSAPRRCLSDKPKTMKAFLAVLALIIAVLALPMLLSPPTDRGGGKTVEGLPWQIEVLPDGTSRVSGLTIGTSTLNDARKQLGMEGETAIVAAPGEAGSLEAYFQEATLGAVTGKLILTADVSPDTIAGMLQRATKAEYMQSSTKKIALADHDLPTALAARIRAIAFVPSINLDEAMIVERFGQPAERLRASKHVEHFLYPERGLDIVLDSEGKEVLQYVPPREFERLRGPLVADNPH